MPKFQRLVVPGYPHHVTQRGVRRQMTFFEKSDYQAYVQLATELLKESELDFYAYCLMPNHIHAVVVPRDRKVLSRFFGTLHRRYAQRTNALHEWKGHLWQERFYSVVMAESHTMAAMRYVELNPVRAGLVERAQEWPWSSTRANLDLTDDPLINRAVVRRLITDWKLFLGEPVDQGELECLRRQTGTGRPAGDDRFIDKLEVLTGRRLRRKRRGRRLRADQSGPHSPKGN